VTKLDPVEGIIAGALTTAGIGYRTPAENGLDFDVYEFGIYIECKRFYSARAVEQCSRADNVILIQGLKAASVFAMLLNDAANG
jgi:hypothetical protein